MHACKVIKSRACILSPDLMVSHKLSCNFIVLMASAGILSNISNWLAHIQHGMQLGYSQACMKSVRRANIQSCSKI